MLIDKLNEFADAVNVFGTAGTANVGDVIDLGVAGRAIGNSFRNAQVKIVVDTAFVGGTSVQFSVVSDGVTTPDTSSASKHGFSKAFTPAELVAGAEITIPLQSAEGPEPYERYLGLQVVRVGTSTAGAISAWISHDGGEWKPYDDAVN